MIRENYKIILGFALVSAFVVGSSLAETIPEDLKLKSKKEDVIGSKEVDGVVKYAYKTNKIIDNEKSVNILEAANRSALVVYDEIKDKRTERSKTYTTNKKDTFITEFVTSPQYYKDENGEWWQADYATTTKNAFDEQLGFGGIIKVAIAADTFYTNNTEDSDGRIRRSGTNLNWADIHDGAGTTAELGGTDVAWGIGSGTSAWNHIFRGVLNFNTASLGAGSTVTAVQLSIWNTTNQTDIDVGGWNIVAFTGAATGFTTSDYQNFGTTKFVASDIAQTVSTGAYTDYTLNASGIANVSVTGYSKFGWRAVKDISNTEPAHVGSKNGVIGPQLSGYAGTTRDPKLVVTYTAVAGAGGLPAEEIIIFE